MSLSVKVSAFRIKLVCPVAIGVLQGEELMAAMAQNCDL